ncbi:MAG TPA: hypothetical protein VGV59_03010 [Pyrinomonadaceae bacterium]|nr:hypothetical protein [Pyrinomonadaceae bacterium]
MYRPNFCAECGERVVRERWRWWTSGRFCTACEARFRLRRRLLATALCASLLSVGFVAGRSLRPGHAPAPPLVVKRAEQTHAHAPADAHASRADVTSVGDGAGGKAREPATDPQEIVSICGARTKKGTPCSRRVRGVGRCWQHRGRPAMLPPSKLIVPG